MLSTGSASSKELTECYWEFFILLPFRPRPDPKPVLLNQWPAELCASPDPCFPAGLFQAAEKQTWALNLSLVFWGSRLALQSVGQLRRGILVGRDVVTPSRVSCCVLESPVI